MKINGWKRTLLALAAIAILTALPLPQVHACGGGGSDYHHSDSGHHGAYGSYSPGYPVNPGPGTPGPGGHMGAPGNLHGQAGSGTRGPAYNAPVGQPPAGQPHEHAGHRN